jgi:hypothetical protein
MYINPTRAIFHLTAASALVLSLGTRLIGASANVDGEVLDAESLERQEDAIVSSVREESWHRGLQSSNNCMADLYGGATSLDGNVCTANSIEFIAVTGVQVYDAGAYQDNVTGIWKGACRGKDDYVNLAFKASIDISGAAYDVGMYINTEGGADALTGTCTPALISTTVFYPNLLGVANAITFAGGDVLIGEFETGSDADRCPDVDVAKSSGGGILTDYPFAPASFLFRHMTL